MDVKMHRSGIKESLLVGMREDGFSKAAQSAASTEEEFWRQPERCLH